MKRLLCIVSAMNTGGAETFLMKVYRVIDRTQYQFDFCVNIFEKGYYDDEIESLGGKIYRIPSKSSNYLEYKKQLSTLVKENQYEYVFRTVANAFGLLDLKIAKKAGTKRCIARSSNASDGESKILKVMNELGKRLFLKYADVKIAPSELAAKYTFGEDLCNRGKVKILNNGLDLKKYHYSEKERNHIREELQISPNTKVVGHIGRFTIQKNHDFLIDVFEEISKCIDSVLILVGEGELEEYVKEKVARKNISSKVYFLGIRSDIPALLSAMDIMIVPSFYEGMPNTVIEAQATGLPCLVSDRITREANVTGAVKYLSISETPLVWAQQSIECLAETHDEDLYKKMEDTYEINTVSRLFIQYIFE